MGMAFVESGPKNLDFHVHYSGVSLTGARDCILVCPPIYFASTNVIHQIGTGNSLAPWSIVLCEDAKSTEGWFVYLLECEDGSLYCGVTNDLIRRFGTHFSGKGAKYTRSHKPVRVAWFEKVPSKGEALRREHQVKSMTRAGKLALIAKARRRPRSRKRS